MRKKKRNSLDGIQQGPVPPLGCLDFETMQVFLDRAKRFSEETQFNYYVFLNWAIDTLLQSLESDSASRIFLDKTETEAFEPEDLFPFSAVPSYSVERVSLKNAHVIAPMWNDTELCQALYDVRRGIEVEEPNRPKGYYIADIDLAVICTSGIHHAYFTQLWNRGEVLLKVAYLEDMADVIRTDGENWYVAEVNDEETWYPVAEPRMAAVYSMALERARRIHEVR